MKELKVITPIFRLLREYPLHLVAAVMASFCCQVLQNTRPMFVRLFIDEYSGGTEKKALLIIVALMVFGVLLSFLFDFISVTIKRIISWEIEFELRKFYSLFLDREKREVNSVALRFGVSDLSRMSLSLGIDSFLYLMNLTMIFSLIYIDQPNLAFGTMIIFTLFLIVNYVIISKLSNKDQQKESKITKILGDQLYNSVEMFKYYPSIHYYRTGVVFVGMVFVVMTPVVYLSFFIGEEVSSGNIAEIFLYFGLLSKPFNGLNNIMMNFLIRLKRSQSYMDVIKKGLEFRTQLQGVDHALVEVRDNLTLPESTSVNNWHFLKDENVDLTKKRINFFKNRDDLEPDLILEKGKLRLALAEKIRHV